MRLVKHDAHEPLTLETDSRKEDIYALSTIQYYRLLETSTKRDGYISGADEKVI